MLDPVTAITAATTAYNALQRGIAFGRELHDMGSQLSAWGKAASDLAFMDKKAKEPSTFRALFPVHSADAIEIFAAKKKAEAQRDDLRKLINFTYGPAGWTEFLAIEARIRKEQQDAVYRKEEIKEAIILWGGGTLIVMAGLSGAAVAMYFFGRAQGRW